MAGKKSISERCHLSFLKLLKKLTSEERTYAISYLLSDSAIDKLSSCIYNALHCDLKIPSEKRRSVRKRLGKQSKNFEYIADRANSVQQRRTKLSQSGSGNTKKISCTWSASCDVCIFFFQILGLGILLSVLVPAISSIIASQT